MSLQILWLSNGHPVSSPLLGVVAVAGLECLRALVGDPHSLGNVQLPGLLSPASHYHSTAMVGTNCNGFNTARTKNIRCSLLHLSSSPSPVPLSQPRQLRQVNVINRQVVDLELSQRLVAIAARGGEGARASHGLDL